MIKECIMKILIIVYSFILILSSPFETFSQFDLGKTLKKKLEKKAERETDKAIDKGIDETEEAIMNSGKKSENENQTKTDKTDSENSIDNSEIETSQSATHDNEKLTIWSKYDFVPGEKIIFEDDLTSEESGEFPSRWDLLKGSAEVASLGGDKVIHLTHHNSIVQPLMNKKDFLPDVFTIEFDVFFEEDGAKRSDIYKIRFFEGTSNYKKIDGKNIGIMDITWNSIKMGEFGGKTATFMEEKKNWKPKWKHIAIAFNQRSLKVYMDQERMLNIPNLGFKPKTFSIGGYYDDRFIKMSSIKNIRVNEGGNKLYDRIMSEGKFITRGILFDVNKSTIKGESMGTINEIVELMKEHTDLNFRIEGHTDSDGDDAYNQKLSDERASAVKNVLIQSGVDASRLDSKGYGEGKPVDENSTPEGKANNRRVEFIKI
jgi:outer membrane protein OmpA-like peptidoglycan-associated protein